MTLLLSPITLTEAFAYVTENHRHQRAPQGELFAVAKVGTGMTKNTRIDDFNRDLSALLAKYDAEIEVTEEGRMTVVFFGAWPGILDMGIWAGPTDDEPK